MLWRTIPLPLRVLIVVALAAAFFALGHRYSSNEWALRYIERENALLRKIEKQTAWARALEHSLFRQSVDREAAYLQGARDVQARTERTIADLRAGNVRLRRELAEAACELSGPAPAAGSADAGAAAGLWREAAADLVRLADECDVVVHQLSACQGLLRDYQSAWSR
jgi:hypothetical protein